MPGLTHTIAVDEQLLWVVHPPTLQVGAARPSSPEQLVLLGRPFDAGRDGPNSVERHDALVVTVALAVLESLREPPELPYIGEPFGGQDVTD
jgi:hypothetical protein